MGEIDYRATYWFLVETGHLQGSAYKPGDLFRFQPKDRELFSEIVLFDSEEKARGAVTLLDEKDARVQLGMKLEAKTIATPVGLADLLDRMQSLGVDYVTFTSGLGQPDRGVPIELAIIGFRSA